MPLKDDWILCPEHREEMIFISLNKGYYVFFCEECMEFWFGKEKLEKRRVK